MNISEIFIRRPVMTTLVMGGVLFFGLFAYRLLPVSDLPNVDFPVIQVSASLPGASPETMATSVATPLEREFSTIAGLEAMTSTNFLGNTTISLQFALDRDLDAAAQDVQAAISRASRQLPQDLPSPPSYRKVNPADQPILWMGLTSPTLPLWTLDEYGEVMLAQQISMVSGVAQVQVYGAQKYAVRVQLDPTRLQAYGLGLDEVTQAVRQANVNLPTGTLWGSAKAYTVQAKGQLLSAEAYRPIIVAYRNGRPIHLEALGRVVDSVENDKTAAWFVDSRAVVLAIQKQPGTNTVEVARRVRELLPKFREQLPASVSLHVLFDRSESIRASVRDVQFTLVFTLFLVAVVIFLFLRNLSATLIPSLAMPLSIVGTFAVMYLLGFSLDNLSLMALTLSVGFVVDDAIVMLENIVRHMEMGKRPWQAALDGSKEVGFTIVSMTLSLAAVFIPVLFLGGIVGRLFREFAVTIGVAVLISGSVSLSLTPMMGSRFLLPPEKQRKGKLYEASEKVFAGMLRLYERGLSWSLNHRRLVMVGTFVVSVLAVVLFVKIPKGFLPLEDIGQLFGFTEAAEGTSFEAMVAHQQALARVVKDDPAVEGFMSSVGRGGFAAPNTGVLFIRLKDRRERDDAFTVLARLRPKLAAVPGIVAYLQVPPPINIGGRLTQAQYQFTLQSPDTETLYRVAPVLAAKLKELPQLVDVNTDLRLKNPQLTVDIDRDRASSLGITAEAIEDALYAAFGPRQISTMYAPTNQYRVLVELLPEYQRNPEHLSLVYVRSKAGQLVPLTTVARVKEELGPLSVNHAGQLPAVTVSFNLAPGVALGEAVAAVQKVAREVLPAHVTTGFQGTAQAFQSSMAGLGLLLVMAILVIYLVLGILYESFIHPLTILSALPLAAIGAVITLMAFGSELNVYAFVGVIMLVGLVKKNGIIMIDFAIEAQKQGKDRFAAIYEACLVRFRPIMMTTMAALFGTLPIAVGYGAGAESRRPLGLAVVGGLLFSQFLTLFVTPVVYTYMEALQTRLGKLFYFLGGREAVKPAADQPLPHP
ncbi:MAG: multidrug transporter [Thermoanaerobaculum sp.]|nr:MAG: multidrug transporter [Thermoanaerobaculum sp.]